MEAPVSGMVTAPGIPPLVDGVGILSSSTMKVGSTARRMRGVGVTVSGGLMVGVAVGLLKIPLSLSKKPGPGVGEGVATTVGVGWALAV